MSLVDIGTSSSALHERLQGLAEDGKQAAVQAYLELVDSEPSRLSFPDFPDDAEWINTKKDLTWASDLHGKVVVIDFFTYCCINCLHVLPDLRALEAKYAVNGTDGVIVVGVHSAKFANERLVTSLQAAAKRYDITHPVVNDGDAKLWSALDVQCWPTILVISPIGQQIIGAYCGEGHGHRLADFVSLSLAYYSKKGRISSHPVAVDRNSYVVPPSAGLYYPGKVAVCSGKMLVIADSGHNRILVVEHLSGSIKYVVGRSKAGFVDGSLEEAEFNAPQGICISNDGDRIYVCDTENHAIRQIDLATRRVTTIAGTGSQGFDRIGGMLGCDQVISSPWDVVLYEKNGTCTVLIIAMAGTHQIWGLFLEDSTWWKNVSYKALTCVALVGSGNEENRNNSYPKRSGFAQPSGLCIDTSSGHLYVADSESSTIRVVSLHDGSVKGLVGGDRDPTNLFAYGDVDGTGIDVRLQHPLGVAKLADRLYVADSYNHKLKSIDVATKLCKTVTLQGATTAVLAEPGGLCVDAERQLLYVANTNYHRVQVIDPATGVVNPVSIKFPDGVAVDKRPLFNHSSKSVMHVAMPKVTISERGTVILSLNLQLSEHLHFSGEVASRARLAALPEGFSTEDDCTKEFFTLLEQPRFFITPSVAYGKDLSFSQDMHDSHHVLVEVVAFYCEASACKQALILFDVPLCRAGSQSTARLLLPHVISA